MEQEKNIQAQADVLSYTSSSPGNRQAMIQKWSILR